MTLLAGSFLISCLSHIRYFAAIRPTTLAFQNFGSVYQKFARLLEGAGFGPAVSEVRSESGLGGERTFLKKADYR